MSKILRNSFEMSAMPLFGQKYTAKNGFDSFLGTENAIAQCIPASLTANRGLCRNDCLHARIQYTANRGLCRDDCLHARIQ